MNVRLDPERLRRARALRQRGVSLSDLVREAIDKRFETEHAVPAPAETKGALHEILDRYPAPGGVRDRTYDVHDRLEAREAIVRRLRGRR